MDKYLIIIIIFPWTDLYIFLALFSFLILHSIPIIIIHHYLPIYKYLTIFVIKINQNYSQSIASCSDQPWYPIDLSDHLIPISIFKIDYLKYNKLSEIKSLVTFQITSYISDNSFHFNIWPWLSTNIGFYWQSAKWCWFMTVGGPSCLIYNSIFEAIYHS